MKKNILSECFVALIVLLFTYTAFSKFLDQNKFIFQMSLAPIHGMRATAPYLAIILPTIELMIAAALLFDKLRIRALYTTIGLLTAFEIYITAMLLSGRRLPCTCGGIVSKMSWGQHLIFNVVFILMAAFSIYQIKRSKRIPAPTGNSSIKDLSRA